MDATISLLPIVTGAVMFAIADRVAGPSRIAFDGQCIAARRLLSRPAPVLPAGIPTREQPDELYHYQGRRPHLLQGLGAERRAADRVPSRLAAQRRRLGQSDAVL